MSSPIKTLAFLIATYIVTFSVPGYDLVKEPVSTLALATGSLFVFRVMSLLMTSVNLHKLMNSIAFALAGFLVNLFLQLLLGMPITIWLNESFMLAAYAAVLVWMDVGEVIPTRFDSLRELFSFTKKGNTRLVIGCQRIIILSFLGAWFGGFLFPLDWQKDYQKWPVPVVCGVYIGYNLASLVNLMILI